MADFKVIETQEELDRIISDRLSRERSSMEKKFAEYLSPDAVTSKMQDLNDQIAGLTTQLNEVNEKSKQYEQTIADKDALIKKHETDSVKNRIAHEIGLPYESIGFLQGEDEDSIKKSAETLKGIVGKGSTMPMASNDPAPADKKEAGLKDVLSGLNL